MSDQILTQEEIDALLSAMDRGDVDLKEGVRPDAEVVPYSLTAQNIMLRDQFSALEEVYDKFGTLLGRSLPGMLQRPLEVQFVPTEMHKYEEFINTFSSPTSFHLFGMAPLIGNAVLAIEPQLVFSLIDCMFGGDGKPTGKVREFTMIEQRMLDRVAVLLLEDFQRAWATVCPIRAAVKRTESKPEFIHLAAPNDWVLTIVLAVKSDEFSGNIKIGIPYLMLEPIKEKLSSKYLQQKDKDHSWGPQLMKLLQDIRVTLIAELGKTTQTVGELLKLEVQDVIHLNTGPEDLVTLSVEWVPKYRGYPGVIKGNRAVEITTLLHNTGGEQ